MTSHPSPMTILLVDDHPVFRSGLALTAKSLFDNANIIEVGDLSAVLNGELHATPDLLLLDLMLPGFAPEHDFPTLRKTLPLTPILVVSMVHDGDIIDTLMKAGANGFVSKAAPPEDLSAAILAVMDGETIIRRAASLPSQNQTSPDQDPITALSPRQLDVVRHIAHGLSNKEIARELDISPFTVRIHVSAALRTLGLSNRSALASFASARGLA